MFKTLKENKGFTIIEVLIVLAIAGLIMVVVFIAVPNLQRSQRNEARNNDARLITTAVSDCLSNKNGNNTVCDAAGEVVFPNNLRELTGAPAPGSGGTLTVANWGFGRICDATGTSVTTGATPRQFTVTYQVETGGAAVTRCIQG